MTFENLPQRRYPIPQGLYTQQMLESIAMIAHLDLMTGHDLHKKLQEADKDATQRYLEGLIRANSPAYNARRERA